MIFDLTRIKSSFSFAFRLPPFTFRIISLTVYNIGFELNRIFFIQNFDRCDGIVRMTKQLYECLLHVHTLCMSSTSTIGHVSFYSYLALCSWFSVLGSVFWSFLFFSFLCPFSSLCLLNMFNVHIFIHVLCILFSFQTNWKLWCLQRFYNKLLQCAI